ncbi:Pre-mRNA-splicing factor 38A [Lamellibrachia satsuma]|nr:Pre-mRNA-splicing factor 38A [Lamellibrachia satsuma]
MANRTVKDAQSVKGTNPQYLVEKIIRSRIYECRYWKEECFALSAELLVDKAMQLKYVGGVYGGNIKPAPFLCLILKMLQIQPEKDIIVEFITQHDFKYVRALGAVYMRLTGTSLDCYKYLEPLYLDYRKIRRQTKLGTFEVTHMDEFINQLLHEERSVDIILPRIQKRHILEDSNQLELRVSALDDEMDDLEESEEEEEEKTREIVPNPENRPSVRDWDRPRRSPSPRFRRSRSRSPHRRRPMDRDREHDRMGRDRDRDRNRERERHRSRERHRERPERHRSKEREREREREKHKTTTSHRHRHKEEEDNRGRHHKGHKRGRSTDDDIREANELRAKLGMPPLRM